MVGKRDLKDTWRIPSQKFQHFNEDIVESLRGWGQLFKLSYAISEHKHLGTGHSSFFVSMIIGHESYIRAKKVSFGSRKDFF